jgi:anti-sigma factor ChrR (cupin superfamily)
MSYDEFVEKLSDYLDGALDEAERRAVAAHLNECASCRISLDELRTLVEHAHALPSHEAPEEVWERIRARVGGVTTSQPTFWSSKTALWMAVAACLVLAAGLWLVLRGSRPDAPAQDELVTMVADELRAADTHYQKAIDGLEQIIAQNQGALPPELNAVLDQNLALIENAIEESRQALATAPSSTVAQESLLSALRRKVSLLQSTILLINEVRKGEGENALDLIEEIRETGSSPNPI